LNAFRRFLGLAWLAAASTAALHADDLASRVVILANSADGDSMRVAEHYAVVRAVPRENIIALKLPSAEAMTWTEFVNVLWQPLQDELVRQRWIDGIAMTATDSYGRRKLAVWGHRIAALVVCRGVPLKVEHDPLLYRDTPPLTQRPEFRTNASAVDSELSLLAFSGVYPINAYLPNPLYLKEHPTEFDRAQVVKVSRLDGPTVDDALGLIDRASAAERTGLLGRAYIDIGGPHANGEQWLESAAKQLADLGFDPTVDREGATFPATVRFDAPVLYFGWYAASLNGPFALPGFRFPPGAVALHIHSYSASSVRSPTEGWVGPLIARGVTATFGNVREPYLELTHRPQLALRALARGDNLVDAAYYAMPELSWQGIVIGDPLYRPFAVALEAQRAGADKLPPALAGYAALREANLLGARRKPDEALAVLRQAQRDTPSLALGVALAQHLKISGDPAGAVTALSFAAQLEYFPVDQWGLTHEAAELIAACGKPAAAVEIYLHLFAVKELPRELKMAWVADARKAAFAAGDSAHAVEWTVESPTTGEGKK